MGIAFVPLYIKYLGMEAYGLIGLFVVMQISVTLLDMGMTPTLNREMARYTSGAHSPQSIRNLLHSLEMVCFTLAVLIAIGIWSISGYLASDWLNAERLPTDVVVHALVIMAVVTALRFCEGIYRGSLFGLQRQVWYNGAQSILSTLRYGGAVAVLAWGSPTIEAFFVWQAVVSMISVAVFASKVHRALPRGLTPARFSREAVSGIWRFAGGMMGISVLSLLLTQVDKVLLSRLLSLESFGYYTLAATIAGVLYTMIVPIDNALYPRMVELLTHDDQKGLITVYHRGAQLVTVLTGPIVMLFMFFAEGIVFTWSGDASLAESTAPILSILALGTFLNGLMQMPYHLQLAHAWTSLSMKVNIVAVCVLVPAIFWAVPQFGAVGAAWIWVVLNGGYVLCSIQFMHSRLIPTEKWRWYFCDVIVPMSGAIGVALIAQQLRPMNNHDRLHWFVFLGIVGVLALAVASVLANRIRPHLLAIMRVPSPWQARAEKVFTKYL